MDKQTAVSFVERIEAHRERESAIWQEMCARPDYEMHEDKTIAAILDARKRARDLLEEADSDLSAFDWVDDGTGNFVPREELEEKPDAAWPSVSAKLREELRDNPKALKMLDQIDKLHEINVSRGFPVPSREDFEAELARLEHA